MKKNNAVPKWQQELRSFLGIKSGLIIEGNVYDDYPLFDFSGEEPEFLCTDSMDAAISGLTDPEKTLLIFFDPVNGFYTDGEDPEDQKKKMEPLMEGYNTTETLINHGTNTCLMTSGKARTQSGSRLVWASEVIRRAMLEHESEQEDGNLVFVLNFASRLEHCNMQPADANVMFMNLMAATTGGQRSQNVSNSLVMVVDKYNDIPAWFYLNNPNVRTITLAAPERSLRRMYLENYPFGPFQTLAQEDYEPGKRFVAETEGMRLKEISQILRLAERQKIRPDDIGEAFRLYKYGISDNPWENLENDILVHIEEKLSDRVKGQDEALQKVRTVITRAVKGLSGLQHSENSHKPKGILFFAGPTGVGKTETAKALAESIFGDENACIRFDMSEYRLPESDQKLFGAPPGYVGYEGGGQLTNAVKNRPFSILLFDELEKASPTIMDKFLQILEDGRMTDNQGNTVYFGETIIIFTSNIGLTKEVTDPDDVFGTRRHKVPTITVEDPEKPDTPEFKQHVTETLTEGVRSYFIENGRPELLNRLGMDNIVVFQFIDKSGAEAICASKLKKICQSIRSSKGIEIHTDDVLEELKHKAVLERENGGRGVGNMLEREFQNPLAVFLSEQDSMPKALRCHLNDDKKIVFEVMPGDA